MALMLETLIVLLTILTCWSLILEIFCCSIFSSGFSWIENWYECCCCSGCNCGAGRPYPAFYVDVSCQCCSCSSFLQSSCKSETGSFYWFFDEVIDWFRYFVKSNIFRLAQISITSYFFFSVFLVQITKFEWSNKYVSLLKHVTIIFFPAYLQNKIKMTESK